MLNIPYATKINELEIATPISNESHLVGLVGTATYASNNIRLVQVPQHQSPSSVSIPGYHEVTSFTSTNQFIVDYTTGVITFSSDVVNGTSVSVSYNGLGSEYAAEDVNELQNPLGTIANQTIVYNWPSAPTVSWSLGNNIVKPANISNTISDNFTFPNNVIVSNQLEAPVVSSNSVNVAQSGVVRLANTSDTISWRNAANSADLALTVNNSNQLTFNGIPIESNTLTSSHIFVGNASNVATDTALSGDATLSNTGVITLANTAVTAASYTWTNFTVDSKGRLTAASSNATPVTSLTGTPNQVNVSASSGPVTLSTPQNIDSTASPTFESLTLVSVSSPATEYTFDTVGRAITIAGGINQTAVNVTLTNFGTGGAGLAFNGPTLSLLTSNCIGAGTTTLTGGSVTLSTGNFNVSGTNTALGGSITLTTGTIASGGTNVASGGSITLTTGNSNGGTETGGNLTLTAFTPSGGGNLYLTGSGSSHGQICVGGSSPDASASVDIQSTSRGFLPPRMSDPTTAISSPAEGLIAYSTSTHQFLGYNGTSWVILG